jgi:hypothetical protein
VLDDALVPRGRLRLDLSPVFTSCEERFGRTATGETGREALGEDLESSSAETLFPGAHALRSAIDALSATPGYVPVLGETTARVRKDVTRVELGAHLGVFDWLTIGATLPWTRTRSSVDVHFQPDTLGGNVGLNPGLVDAPAVASFLVGVSSAEASAQARAAQTCGSSPASVACTSAQALADYATAFRSAAQTAYGSTPFFPMAGSAAAAALEQATSALDTELVAAGLPGIGAPIVFASDWVDEATFLVLPTTAQSGVDGSPLGSVRGIWQAGDVEVSATARLLESAEPGPEEPRRRFGYSLLATVVGRLPTGQVDDPDVFLDVGTGDGQTDIEGRLQGLLTVGDRIAVLGGLRYGVQLSRTLELRVAPPESVLAPLSSRRLVEWSPGAYWGVEIAPGYRFSEELSFAAEYRAFRKYRDGYALVGSYSGTPVDPAVLEQESGVTLHEVGGTLRYDTVARWLGGGDVRLLQLRARVLKAVAGGGGQTPVTTRVEFGVRIYQGIWGGR